jgi:hypothetical protein
MPKLEWKVLQTEVTKVVKYDLFTGLNKEQVINAKKLLNTNRELFWLYIKSCYDIPEVQAV